MNLGICGRCRSVVPLSHIEDKGKEYLVKHCPDCGDTREYISCNSAQYRKKRALMSERDYPGCSLNCLECNHIPPNIVFIETTNRCNMNCPICITNVPSMGFEFEPRMEYFEKIFEHYSHYEFPPSIQLFGGEPTMRDDIFDVIRLARSYGLSVRLVTNGLKLADQGYCDKIMSSGASVLISFDGLKKEMYEKLRAFPGSLDLKFKALQNISRHKSGKVVLMTVIDKHMNGEDMPKFLDYCIEHSGIIRGIFLMPLTHVWSDDVLEYDPERTTQEDVESIVDNAVEGKIDFVPLGAMEFKNLARIYKIKHMPFLGVHPNCESFTLLISNGEKYASISNYLKKDVYSLVKSIKKLDESVEKHSSPDIPLLRKTMITLRLAPVIFKHVNFGAVVNARGIKAAARWISIISSVVSGKKFKDVLKDKTGIKSILQVLLLPFEDDKTLESERLEKCASCFAYIDIKTGEIKSIPFCIWEKYKKAIMRDMALEYNKDGYTRGLPEKGDQNEQVKNYA